MVAAVEENAARIVQLEGHQGQNHFHRERAPVHEVPVEQVRVFRGGEPVDAHDVQQVVVLSFGLGHKLPWMSPQTVILGKVYRTSS